MMSHIMGVTLCRKGISIGQGLRLYGTPIVDVARGSTICIGDRVVLCSRSRSTALGINHPVVLRTLRPGAELELGDDSGLSGGSICAAFSVVIGAGCLIGANTMITDTDFHPLESAERRYASLPRPNEKDRVVIGDNVFVGANATILKGVRIGSNSVIGAGSVVCDSIPPSVVAAGNPCRVIRPLDGDLKGLRVGQSK
jgi:acetyltransferase-like isoleucine patch superfamily enzyme